MKKIPLTQGKAAIIDDEDYPELIKHKWFADNNRAITYIRGKRVYMHRLIAQTPDNMFTDHVNRDSLDNRSANLRICTITQNSANRTKQRNNKSGYKGVKRSFKKFQARITVNGNKIHLGSFSTPEEAAGAYDKAAKEVWGEFAALNFPE